LTALQRVYHLADEGTWEEWFEGVEPTDPLGFHDTESYADRLQAAQEKTGRKDAVWAGSCLLEGKKIALGVLDFSFMAGSMGSVVGEKLTRLIEQAIVERLPLVIVSASGGARMQESILSLMQMAKTASALAKLHEEGLAYISVLTHPTTGGVTASFAALGDVILAEPKALIAFAGPRVVEQTIGQKLPEGAQKSEFLLEKGMIDCIVNRHELKGMLCLILSYVAETKERSGVKNISLPHQNTNEDQFSEKLKALLSAAAQIEAEV
jgi:acetyl-CoA carboxylase carboxyl transferase subunit beta